MKSSPFIVLAFCFALLAPPEAVAVPRTINFQGFLTTAGGTPVNATVAMTFRLYDVESDGVHLWTETKAAVAVGNGVFSVLLGSPTPIPLPFDVPYWISVAVNGDAEMTPRQPLASSPYALRAAVADGVGPVACPAGMTKVALPFSTLCFAAGPAQSWDTADTFCGDSFAGNLCTLVQWRNAVCRVGIPNPGASWTSAPAGTATFATVSGCTADAVGAAVYTTQRVAACCLEWMKY